MQPTRKSNESVVNRASAMHFPPEKGHTWKGARHYQWHKFISSMPPTPGQQDVKTIVEAGGRWYKKGRNQITIISNFLNMFSNW